MMVWAIVIIGGLSFLVWAHHMYVSGMNPYFGFFFAISTLVIAIPTAIKVYNWLLTLWRGAIHLRVARTSVVSGKSVAVRVDLGGRLTRQKNTKIQITSSQRH